ncbi:MAG: AAA family ATPase [Candidatus Methanomethylophilaceae archaeon]|jgi:CO dehydrogenase maturation factor
MTIIALAGKGGVGKSTIASQIVRRLSARGTVLAVDADPNSNLSDKIGLETKGTIGELRDEIIADPGRVPSGVSKQQYVYDQVQRAMTETDSVDLLVMGRPEGEGCYCFINSALKECFVKLIPNYDFTVVDNEAGMEHMSRKVLPQADVFLFVSDPTVTGIKTAGRLSELAEEVGIEIGRKILIVNNLAGNMPEKLSDAAAEAGFAETLALPHDSFITESAMESEVLEVPDDTPFGESLLKLLALIV